MAYDQHIRVEYSNGTLMIDESQRDLVLTDETSSLHSAVWYFEGIEDLVAAGYYPSLEFEESESVTATMFSGPFIEMGRTPSSVIACGNDGIQKIYHYRATLIEQNSGRVIRSQDLCSIDNQVSEQRPAVARVIFVAENEPLVVEPDTIRLVTGQSILWEVVEAPSEIADWYPRLDFSEGNPYFGPFTSLETRDKSLLGAGSGTDPRLYNYRFQMVSTDNDQVLFESSPDPELDDEGDPSGGSSPVKNR